MGRLTSPQKKGKLSSYTGRFLKKEFPLSAFPVDLNQLQGYKVDKFLTLKNNNSVIAKLVKEGELSKYYVAPLGCTIGSFVDLEPLESPSSTKGLRISLLRSLKVGTCVYNVEFNEAGSKHMFRTGGTHAKVLAIGPKTIILVHKGRTIKVNENLRCIVGVPSAGGKLLKPLARAGHAYKKFHAKGKKYVRVSGNAKEIIYCPGGGSNKRKRGINMCVSRNAPAGRKYGNIAPKRTGKKK